MKLKSTLVAALCACGSAGAATCTYNGAWDTTPQTGDDIVITDGALTWDTSLPATVASWKQTGGTVTFGTTYADATGVTILEVVNVTGDVSFTGGTWTHKANSDKKQFRLYVNIGGDMTMGEGAVITADGLGYKKLQAVNGNKDGGTQGGTYGGHGSVATAKANWTYGSYAAPEDIGNGGLWMSYELPAGGAIRLDVTGALTLNGAIHANSTAPRSHYCGSGGSVYINAGTITGTGTLNADAGSSQYSGGGGRIAVVLHGEGADFANYDLKTLASAKSTYINANAGGCGTIYGETSSDEAGHGWLILKGTGTAPTGALFNLGWADPFTYEYTTLRFAKISVSGKTKLIVNEGNTLDLTGTTLDMPEAGYGIMMNGGMLKTDAEGAFNLKGAVFCNVATTIDSGNVVVEEGGVLAGREKITIPGNLTVKNGGKLETDIAADAPTHALYLDVAGNLTIEEGGMIDVTGQGYTPKNSPEGAFNDSSGASYAGKGIKAFGNSDLNCAPTYGSIINPLTCGMGGTCGVANPTSGGGVVRLEIGGVLTVDGSIVSNGKNADYYPGAGGSINVIAASIAGSGLIQAHGGDVANDNRSSSSGGRIAVRLTGEGKTFDDFKGTWDARAGARTDKTYKRGGAGTIYLQTAAEGENGGTLIVDGGVTDEKIPNSAETSLGGNIEGLEFGNVIIKNKANLVLADNATLIVKGNFQNESSFVAGAGSTVQFAGSGESVVSGDNTFVNFGCATDGKVIKFADESKQTVTGAMTVSGGDSKITLCAENDGSWYLDASKGSATLSGVKIGGCQSTAALTITDGDTLGGNSENITIQGSVTPETVTWSGAIDGAWATEGNWDKRVPTRVDTVIIPAGKRTATLAASAKVAALTVAGTLDVADKGIDVTGNMTITGTLIASGAAPINVASNLTISGAFTAGSSIVTLNGTTQTVNCAGGVSFASLVVAGPAATFASDINAASFTLGAGTFTFAKDIMVNATKFIVNGDAETKNAVLKPLNAGDIWNLMVSASTVTGATVSGSDASAGLMIVPSDSVDAGDNTNWLFNDTRLHWTGAVDSDFANPANWKGGQLPTSADEVVIEGKKEAVITGVTEVASLTLGLGAKLTVNTNLTCNGALLVEGEGTLIANKPIDVKGNLSVLDDATVTHDINVGVEQYKVDFTVGGSAYFAKGAKINLKGKGYKYVDRNVYRGPGAGAATGDSFTGSSHGGRGFHGNTPAKACYGSVFNPVNIGSAGGWVGNGGGAFILSVAGALTLDATIDADGEEAADTGTQSSQYYTGSGGSINITAATMTGVGSLRACGGKAQGTTTGLCGGGGRIAVVLTGESATLDGFTGSMIVYGGFRQRDSMGSAGTIYTKAGSQSGLIKLAQNPLYIDTTSEVKDESGAVIGRVRHELTDFPAEASDNVTEKTIGTEIEVQPNCVLNLLADAEIADLRVLAKSNSDQKDGQIKLNGHKLIVHSRKPNAFGRKPSESALFDNSRVDTGDGGEIVWDMKPTLFILK